MAGSWTKLTTKGNVKDLEEISLGTIDLGQVEAGDEPLKLPVNLPDGVINRSGFTEVTVTVELPSLISKDFVINRDDIQIVIDRSLDMICGNSAAADNCNYHEF